MSFPELPLKTVHEFLKFEDMLQNNTDLQDELVK